MGFYDRWILPRLVDTAMRHKEAMRYRAQVVPEARGAVLEIGVGSGLNLPFYGNEVQRLYALDPSEELLAMARRKAASTAFPVDFLAHSGEDIPLDDASIDTVVMTWTLCSIPDPARALLEMKRVLKPGGSLLFAEHGLAPEPGVQHWQRRLNPLWRRITSGCNLDRKMDWLIRNAGLCITHLDEAYAKGPRPMSYVYAGCAVCI
jgi:ubiquinone/menaquinone biosynthesis C-methylase UbiE